MDEIRFTQKPYKVTYYDMNGDKKVIRRVPPKKMHDILPTDIVEIKVKHSDDFDIGDNFEVKGINPRHPNVVHIHDDDEHSTFVSYLDLDLKEKRAPREGDESGFSSPTRDRYLLWP